MDLRKNKTKAPIFFSALTSNIKTDKDGCKTKIFFASLLINIFLIALILATRNFIPPEVPLFYGLPEGERQIAPWWLITTPALLSTLFTILNFIICNKSSNNFVKQISTYILIPINFFSTIAIVKIILLVGSF